MYWSRFSTILQLFFKLQNLSTVIKYKQLKAIYLYFSYHSLLLLDFFTIQCLWRSLKYVTTFQLQLNFLLLFREKNHPISFLKRKQKLVYVFKIYEQSLTLKLLLWTVLYKHSCFTFVWLKASIFLKSIK